MKTVCALFAVLLAFSIAAAVDLTGRVVGVSDGDTITILVGKQTTKVRLYGIDCPEKSQDFGSRAKEFTSLEAFGKPVTVEVKDTDRYGRQVGIVTLPDGRNLNYELVRTGMAWWYRHYSDDDSLRILEQAARDAKLGLWSMENPTPPWEFRKQRRR